MWVLVVLAAPGCPAPMPSAPERPDGAGDLRPAPAPAPMSLGTSPAMGPSTGGLTVSLTGQGFAPGMSVSFAGVAAADTRVLSDTPGSRPSCRPAPGPLAGRRSRSRLAPAPAYDQAQPAGAAHRLEFLGCHPLRIGLLRVDVDGDHSGCRTRSARHWRDARNRRHARRNAADQILR